MQSFNPDHYSDYRYHGFSSRWLKPKDWLKFMDSLRPDEQEFSSEVIGRSSEGKEITAWCWGKGDKIVLIWSQMHGNEPTGTMALADLLVFLNRKDDHYSGLRNDLKQNLSICLIPILNPDGAENFTRVNARGIDINRDAVKQITPEMQAFQAYRQKIDPDYAFNLHDQRSIFSAGSVSIPATISYLAASADENRGLTEARKKAIALIVRMNETVNKLIPGAIGRYSDEFYPRALGDNFHKEGTPCILIESGAAADDPLRDTARKMNFLSLLTAFEAISAKEEPAFDLAAYESIPQNQSLFYDLILRQCRVQIPEGGFIDMALQIDQQPDHNKNTLVNRYNIKEIGDLNYHHGLREISGLELRYQHLPWPDKPAGFEAFRDGKLILSFKDGILHEEH